MKLGKGLGEEKKEQEKVWEGYCVLDEIKRAKKKITNSIEIVGNLYTHQ